MDADKIKNFFILHFEKMILVLILGGSVFLIYRGLQLPDFLATHQPEKLATDASRVKLAIDENHNEEIIPERVPTFDILKQTKILDAPVDSVAYKLGKTFEAQNENSIVRRQDVVLLPPLELITQGVLTTLAIKGNKTDADGYALAKLDPADEVEKVEQPRQRSQRRRPPRGGMGMGMEMEMQMQMEMEAQMSMMSGGPMGATGPTTVVPVRKFDTEFDFGLRPVMGQDKFYPKPSIGWFIAGTALLPHRQVYEAYELALKDADAYDPRRDTPLYYNFEVARADVTDKPVGQLVDADWVKVWDLKRYAELAAGYWSGFAPEIVPADYRDDQMTVWIPPVLLDDYRPFSIHPKIPMLSQQELTAKKLSAETKAKDAEVTEFEFDTDNNIALTTPGAASNYGGGQGSMDGYGMDAMDMMGGGGMMMYGRGKIEADPVEHKLMRFYDFAGSGIFKSAPVPGHTYVYRMRYSVVDPNFPASQIMQPKTSSLSPEVASRVSEKMADAVKNKKRDFQFWSEWSAPSEPSSLPTFEKYVMGPVQPGSVSTWSVGGRPVEYSRDTPKAKVVVSQFMAKYGVKVPMAFEITEGSVLSKKAETADVVDPISLDIRKIPDPEFVSSTTVVDLDGGRPLQITEGLTEPGVMLLYDQSGQLRVSDEIEDLESYRIQSFAEEKGE